jgi:hypothetical protein
MKSIKTLLFISLLSSPSWSATIDDLVQREGIYYQKFNNVPFTGKLTGREQGSFKNGKEEGAWVGYHKNGQLWYEGNYKNGKSEGTWTEYHTNGQLWSKGNYKNGRLDGVWVVYSRDGQLYSKDTYKDMRKISD